MKCPNCGAEMLRLMAFKRKYGSNINICPNIDYHKIDLDKKAVMIPCKR